MSQELNGTLTNSANLVGTFGTGGGGGTTNYNDLANKPQINGVTLQGNKTTSNLNISYNDLTNKPTIPAAQVNSDWNSTSGVSEILNKPSLAAVATSGSYSDLSGTPTIPVNSDFALSGLSDTDITTPTANQVLAYDGDNWVNSSALHIATFSFSKSINATTEATFYVTRSDFNLPTNAKVKDGYIKQSSAVNTSNTWAYACIVNESATNAMQGAIYNPTNSNRNYSVMATVFYYT